MPAPKSKRREAAVPTEAAAQAAGLECLCESAEAPHGCWVLPPSLPHPFNEAKLESMRRFMPTLKGNARASVLRTTPLADVFPQVVEALDIGRDVSLQLAAAHLSDDRLVEGVRAFVQQVLAQPEQQLAGAEVLDYQSTINTGMGQQLALRVPAALVALACDQLHEERVDQRFGGPVPSTHSVISSKLGLMRFPVAMQETEEGHAALNESMHQGMCRPHHGVHFRPWLNDPEVDLYRALLDSCRVMTALAIVMLRRVHKAMLRAELLRVAMAGLASPTLPLADVCQTWTWGQGQVGQLGLGPPKAAQSPTPVPALAGKRVVQLSAAGGHIFALTATGELLSWGDGRYGVTGLHEHEASRVPLPCSAVPHTLQGGPLVVHQVATGELHSAILCGGRVFCWGSMWMGQLGNAQRMMRSGCLLPYAPEDHQGLTTMRPGLRIPAFLTDPATPLPPPEEETGEVGDKQEEEERGPRASLVHLSAVPAQFGPFLSADKRSLRPGPFLQGVVSVAVGSVHTLAATLDGKVWAWGSNEAEHLSLEVTEAQAEEHFVQWMGCECCADKDKVVVSVSAPLEVRLEGAVPAGTKVVQVAAGSALSVALTDRGDVVSWGASHKQPWRVNTALRGSGGCSGGGGGGGGGGARCAVVAAGGMYALAVTRDMGHVWFWSRHHMLEWGTDSQHLGHVMKPPAWQPKQVPFLSKVQHVACSATHGIASTADGNVYWWPHAAALPNSTLPQTPQAYEVVTLRGLSVLSVAVGLDFAAVSTGPSLPAQPTEADWRGTVGQERSY